MSAEDVYNFEDLIPAAVKTILTDAGLNCFTLADEKDFQEARPRVEVTYRQIGEATPKRVDPTSKRTSAFRGDLKLVAISDVDAPGKSIHSTYRSQIRAVIGGLEVSLNATLALHRIAFVISGNEETGVRSGDGYQQTTFPFTIDIMIQPNAWAQL